MKYLEIISLHITGTYFQNVVQINNWQMLSVLTIFHFINEQDVREAYA